MINNDSVVTAYDEHLTLVEWLQKVEVLLKNGGLKETILNDKGNATFSLTLTFNDGTKIESNAMTLKSVNEALTALNNDFDNATLRIDLLKDDVDDLKNEIDFHGFDMRQPFDKTNCVRIGTEFSTEEWTLRQSGTEIELSDEDANKAKQILLKAIKYGFVAYDDSTNIYATLINVLTTDASISATFALNLVIYLALEDGKWKYKCSND